MWKLLRNVLLLTAAMTAALWLLLWVAAQQQAASIAAQLAPWAELRYARAGAGLDGVLSLGGVEWRLKQGPWRDAFGAATVRVRGGGPLWLMTRALSHGEDVPARLQLELHDLHLPGSLQGAVGAWFGHSGVPFDGLGCGAAFVPSDYAAMQRVPQALDVSLKLDLDAAAQDLSADVQLRNAPYAEVRLHAELKPFDYAMLADARAAQALRIGSLTLGYRDLGYFAARGKYCAQRMGWSVEQYIDRHLATVTGFLEEHEIEVGAEPLALYRRLLEQGGEAELLSLPNPGVGPLDYPRRERGEILRLLNLTARLDQAPPILVKLSFLAPPAEEVASAIVTPPPESAARTPATAAAAPVVTAVPTSAAAAANPAAAPPGRPVVAAPPPGVAATSSGAAAPPLPAVATAVVPATGTASMQAVAPAALARPAAPPATEPVLRDAQTGKPVPSSAPAPPGDSTLALVWKGATVERLPSAPAPAHDYRVVALDDLAARIGERVTIVTSGGKEIEGAVAALDAEGVVLRVRRETGMAELALPRQRVHEVRVPLPRHD